MIEEGREEEKKRSVDKWKEREIKRKRQKREGRKRWRGMEIGKRKGRKDEEWEREKV